MILEILDHLDFLVNPDLKETLVNLVLMVFVDSQDPSVNLVYLDLPVLWVSLDQSDQLV